MFGMCTGTFDYGMAENGRLIGGGKDRERFSAIMGNTLNVVAFEDVKTVGCAD